MRLARRDEHPIARRSRRRSQRGGGRALRTRDGMRRRGQIPVESMVMQFPIVAAVVDLFVLDAIAGAGQWVWRKGVRGVFLRAAISGDAQRLKRMLARGVD